MVSPAPTCIGLIGLSSHEGDKEEGVSWAEIAHLPYLRKSPHYEICALLNSSVEAAQAAVRKYRLAENTRVYSDPNGARWFSLSLLFERKYIFECFSFACWNLCCLGVYLSCENDLSVRVR